MLAIVIFKWIFIFSTIALSAYHYIIERDKLTKLSKYIHDPKLMSELQSSARMRMAHFFFLFAAFIVWIMSYDLEIENVNKEKTELANELQKASETYSNLNITPKRLGETGNSDQNLSEDIRNYYTDVMVNYYVMRKCSLAKSDDIFIINSAMMREIYLNNVPFGLRDNIIMGAKSAYLEKFSNIECGQLNSQYGDIVKNYRNYIGAVREVLKATF